MAQVRLAHSFARRDSPGLSMRPLTRWRFFLSAGSAFPAQAQVGYGYGYGYAPQSLQLGPQAGGGQQQPQVQLLYAQQAQAYSQQMSHGQVAMQQPQMMSPGGWSSRRAHPSPALIKRPWERICRGLGGASRRCSAVAALPLRSVLRIVSGLLHR
jgi:hypothetical protein